MPGKMARSASPTTVRAADALVAVLTSRLSWEGQKYANIHARSGVIWGIPTQMIPTV